MSAPKTYRVRRIRPGWWQVFELDPCGPQTAYFAACRGTTWEQAMNYVRFRTRIHSRFTVNADQLDQALGDET